MWFHYATAQGTVVDGTLWFVDSHSVVSLNISPLDEEPLSMVQLCFLLTLANISNIFFSCNRYSSICYQEWIKRTIKTTKRIYRRGFCKLNRLLWRLLWKLFRYQFLPFLQMHSTYLFLLTSRLSISTKPLEKEKGATCLSTSDPSNIL